MSLVDVMNVPQVADPQISPDGKAIAFIARRAPEPDAVSQIFIISTAGGEARALTTHATAVSNI